MPEINIEKEDREIFDRFVSNGKINAGLRRLMTQQWNKCSLCQQSIPTGRPAFAGYGAGGTPLYVDAKCAVFLVELATPVYFSNDLDLSVSNDQQLWRYMDFAKFAAMLRERSLYFPRADKLGDPFEGAFGLARRESDAASFAAGRM